jgi:poly(A) polymerase
MGGCVRDLLLEMQPHDFDIATAAGGRKVDALFFRRRTRSRARLERTLPDDTDITIDIVPLHAPPWVDLAQWRHRRHAERASLAEAFIKSFDYTLNALYYEPTDNVIIDFVNGVDDIRTGTLRLVRPDHRLDVVQVLRGVILASKKGLAIEDGTWEAMRRWASSADVGHKKPVRIYCEMVKALGSGTAARSFALLERMGALPLFLGRGAVPGRELVRIRSLLAALDRACIPGARISALFATLFYYPIEFGLRRTRPRQRGLSAAIDLCLRPLAERLAIPQVIYREVHQILLAMRFDDIPAAGHLSRRAEEPWSDGAAFLRALVRNAEA